MGSTIIKTKSMDLYQRLRIGSDINNIIQYNSSKSYMLNEPLKSIPGMNGKLHIHEETNIIIKIDAESNSDCPRRLATRNKLESNSDCPLHLAIRNELELKLLKFHSPVTTNKLLSDYDLFNKKSMGNDPYMKSILTVDYQILYRFEYNTFNINKDYIIAFTSTE